MRPRHQVLALVLLTALALCSQQQRPSHPWVADNGDGTYKNPILYADYSDPDAIRVGNDYYLVASSFDAVPGLPILHSVDLVNWEIIGHVFAQQPPMDVFSKTQHGNGAWAPAIRYHNGEFYVYWPDPDIGIYMAKARSAKGPWTEPLLVKAAKGWIDPCPLWDDDGNAYLVNAFAASRSGIKSAIAVSRMSAEGTKLLDDGFIVYDGHANDPTIEGPKLYKRNGYYYILAPGGGVPTGWEVALRSKNIYGPYERRVALEQGLTLINGPHQGAWVETPYGESWFLHFQDKGAYGRIVHLQPVRWVDDWPVMGDNGHPVLTHKKPNTGNRSEVTTPADSDEFDGTTLGLQWQWQANPKPGWAFPYERKYLRLIAVPLAEGARNFWDIPNVLLQKFPAPEFTITTSLNLTSIAGGEKAGLIVMGTDYAHVAISKTPDGYRVTQSVCKNADRGSAEKETAPVAVTSGAIELRVRVSEGAVCQFGYRAGDAEFVNLGEPFSAHPGRWIGAKVGLFAVRSGATGESGYADVDWFRVDK